MAQSASIHPLPLADSASSPDMRLVMVGHVDHGKSTLIGRLLYDTDSLPDGKYDQVQASCNKRGMPFEWAFLLDALQAERDQNVTIDTTQIWFQSDKRRYCLIDAPGHREFLKNMLTGAASADAALLLVDAEEGMQAQTRRHAYLLQLLGMRQIVVVINKMDKVGYDEARFHALARQCHDYLIKLGLSPLATVPISARDGEGMLSSSSQMSWYDGMPLLPLVDTLSVPTQEPGAPLRLAVQDVYRFDERRLIVGRVESGSLAVGDTLLFSPSNEMARVASLECWPAEKQPPTMAQAGESVALTLDEQIFVERGQIASHESAAPMLANDVTVRLFWLSSEPLTVGARYPLRLATASYDARVESIRQVVDTNTLEPATEQDRVQKMQVADVTFRLRALAPVDSFTELPRTGRCVVFDGVLPAGGGVVTLSQAQNLRKIAQPTLKSTHIHKEQYTVSRVQRMHQNGHQSGILWFTGLSGSGKSTLARECEKRLFEKGYQVYVLDGDNIRHGLCADLGFEPEDRSENIRRVGEVARLFAEAGFIVITAFIAPYHEDRRRARAIASDIFHTIYIKADLETCEKRDVKGLYQKARAGEIAEFTGISAPYEAPESPDLIVDTDQLSVSESVELLMEYISTYLGISKK